MPAEIDVLIIGAGPSGLFAAVELARRGVRARVVEQEPAPHHQARATAIQPGTLEILARRLTELGGTVERGVRVVSLTQDHDGVTVEVADADGATRAIEARWVIGAGGAHSVTRDSMEETLVGSTYPGTALVAEGNVSCSLPGRFSADRQP